MTTLTRATLGKLTQRATKDIEIGGNTVRIQRPTPLEFSQYQMSLVDKDGKASINKFADAIMSLVAKMWIDDAGNRLFQDNELRELGSIDLAFYQELSEECQRFASGGNEVVLGEFDSMLDLDSHAESA
jgi:hypothetical protein